MGVEHREWAHGTLLARPVPFIAYHFLVWTPDTDCFRVFCCQRLFALAYLAEGIASRTPDLVISLTPFFSVQTMASIGYGVMYPLTAYANAMVAIEALAGLMGLAMGSGLMFARFSQPTARVLFSRVAVIVPWMGCQP